MEQDFYKRRLQDQQIEVCIPNDDDRAEVHRVIYQELCQGQLSAQSKQHYLEVIDKLAAQGAQAVILGCTEISMLLSSTDTSIPLIDTTAVHANKAVELALS
ncbi:hypothetical protein GCM10011369_18100 [Neiella marina]|uniref:Aspartate racemase n=1 Tax=Neiella marina TaxID=508461 RepID=A0A8J2U4Y1_9GAMM|nr:amino acid racemase [Neiella marina]GGA76589.1 hypothetical protein GCM10011369_18100 [Neiella marina]